VDEAPERCARMARHVPRLAWNDSRRQDSHESAALVSDNHRSVSEAITMVRQERTRVQERGHQ
jgi:hypothetical protein